MRAAIALCGLIVSSCATAEPDAQMLRTATPVSPVLTEHSTSLKCLGGLIEQSPQAPVSVVVHEIEDTTVPRYNEERRLSKGGDFVLHTAISRLETAKARGVLDMEAAGSRVVALGGAWTQDDVYVTQRGVSLREKSGNFSTKLGARTGYDFIAGDFTSSINGRVLLSTAVGVALARKGNEALLVVDDGSGGAEIGLDSRTVQGPQMAQRRILEAVALVHLAHFFKIDYRPCLETAAGAPTAFTASLSTYQSFDAGARHRAIQMELQRLGHFGGTPSTRWDPAARKALSAWQATHQLPITGQPSATLYALLSVAPSPAR
jgi:hypothetical protein